MRLAENIKLLYDIFKEAINREREAQKMYKDAIALCEDNMIIRTLEQLLKDELRHEEQLMELYSRVKRELAIARG